MKQRAAYTGAYGVVLLGVLAVWLPGARGLFEQGFGTSLIAIGGLAALLGVVMILAQFVLISRAPWLERAFGFDVLTRIHHWNGIIAFGLITSHIILIISGHRRLTGLSFIEQLELMQQTLPYITAAILAHALLVITIITSIVIVRRHLKYEYWYAVHWLNYAVVFLAIAHQLTHGTILTGTEWFRWFWIGLHGAVFAHLFGYRFIRPVWQYYKHRWRVDKLVFESDDVLSVYVTGNRLDEFDYTAGQFVKWRFLQKGLLAQEHPFTVSLAPSGEHLRLSIKAIGDYTADLQKRLRPGTSVVVSGPLGGFTLRRARGSKLLFIAGGIGITPLRAMLEAVGEESEVTLLYSASKQTDLIFKQELDQLAKKGNISVHYTLSREQVDFAHYGRIDRKLLESQVPDIAERDVFICGPQGFIDSVEEAALSLGVDPSAIHSERFSLH